MTRSVMTPKEIVNELDRYIVGQYDAKRAVAIALRNRWRRMQVDENLRNEIMPKNILMIGPTGIGKTEIARRLAKIADAPFVKVEATKFTEVGYVGRDVDSMARDLVETSVKMVREKEMTKVRNRAEEIAEERILDSFAPRDESGEEKGEDSATRQLFRQKFHNGELDDQEIEVDVSGTNVEVGIVAPLGMEAMTNQIESILRSLGPDRTKRRKMKVPAAFKQLREDEAAKLINEEEIRNRGLENAEQNGIIFIDEIDKIVHRSGQSSGGGEVSREGVQRDLLPLIEGSSVTTKYGTIRTDHILFIASGAFHLSKPSDLIPELQGRLPIRVELKSLTATDFERILKEPDASLIKQSKALLETEGIKLEFAEDSIKKMAEIAHQVNERGENIGARRLHTILERILDKVSFEAPDMPNDTKVIIDADYVTKQLAEVIKDEDLSRYIL